MGVTHTTVSNAFNNPSKLSNKVREEILRYADSVGFHGPDPTGRSLRTGQRGAIGVIFNDRLSYAFTDRHDIAFLRGISSVCEEVGANIVLIPLQNENRSYVGALSAMVDGYILNAPYENNFTTKLALSGTLPAVVVDFDDPNHTSVLLDDAAIMEQMTKYVLSLGHKQIGIITFPLAQGRSDNFHLDEVHPGDNYVASQRLLGCETAIRESEISLENVVVQETINSEDGGSSAMHSIFAENPRITALICFSDRLAYGAMAACRGLGMDVPNDISITGFDDIDKDNDARVVPTLTTIRQDAYSKGRKAAEALLAPGNHPTNKIQLTSEMIIRSSTTKPRES